MADRREHDRIEAEIGRRGLSSDPFASAVRATRMPMLITDPSRADNPIVFVNDAFLRLTGYGREEVVGENCRFLQGPKTSMSDVSRVRDAIERRIPIEIDLLNYKKNGETFWNRLLISPVFDRDGELVYFFASQFDVTLQRDRLVRLQTDRDLLEQEVARRTGDLSRAEERLRFLLKAGRFGSWTLDLADLRLMASEICKQDFGRDPADPFGYGELIDTILPEDRERVIAAGKDAIGQKGDLDVEFRVRHPDGQTRWIHLRGQAFYRADGEPLSMAGVSIDVTERKRGEEHRNLLAAELNHRVKNSMATMQSIAHQTLRNASSLDDARAMLDSRLQSLAAAHDVLTRESWEGATLREIVDGALQAFRVGSGQRFSLGGPSIRLPPRLALAFSMALHELATNAVKYGALSTETGRVILNWDVLDGSEPPRLFLRWEELNGPPVTPPRRKGFGTRMIERALSVELGGRAEIEYRPRGVVFCVEAPLPAPERSRDE